MSMYFQNWSREYHKILTRRSVCQTYCSLPPLYSSHPASLWWCQLPCQRWSLLFLFFICWIKAAKCPGSTCSYSLLGLLIMFPYKSIPPLEIKTSNPVDLRIAGIARTNWESWWAGPLLILFLVPKLMCFFLLGTQHHIKVFNSECILHFGG